MNFITEQNLSLIINEFKMKILFAFYDCWRTLLLSKVVFAECHCTDDSTSNNNNRKKKHRNDEDDYIFSSTSTYYSFHIIVKILNGLILNVNKCAIILKFVFNLSTCTIMMQIFIITYCSSSIC